MHLRHPCQAAESGTRREKALSATFSGLFPDCSLDFSEDFFQYSRALHEPEAPGEISED